MKAILTWTFAIVLCSTSPVWGQRQTEPSDNPQPPNSPSPQRSGENSSSQNSNVPRSQAGTRANGGLDVERGQIPELFSREQQQRGGGQRSQQNRGQRNQSGQNNRSGSQREFIQNALKFDANEDRQLAANELANLFHVLASGQYRQQNGDGKVSGRPPQVGIPVQQPATVSQTSQTTTVNTTGSTNSGTADSAFIQRQSVRQALLLFLQLALQFDTNGDGLLSQPELLGLANALLNNEMGLLNAATQSGGQSVSNRTSTTTSATTTQRSNSTTSGRQGQTRNRRDGAGERPGGRRQDSNGQNNDRPSTDRPGQQPDAPQTGPPGQRPPQQN